jgi:hypothetical protein
MQSILKDWSFIRVIRLLAGVGLIGYGYSIMDWLIIMIGAALCLMAVTNSGCSPFSNSCEVKVKQEDEH